MSDWDTVTVLKKRAPKASTMKSEQAVNAARRQGVPVDTQLKWGAGGNKQHVATKNTAKLDRETEELKHETISLDVGRIIQQGRQAKGLSQKDLATKINEKPQVITDYEAGRGIPNNVIIGKIEKVIGLKLRGNVSFRDPKNGTWFIQELCKNFSAYGRRDDVIALIMRTTKCLCRNYYHNDQEIIKKQMPIFVSTLKKKFYLNRSKDRNAWIQLLKNQENMMKSIEELKVKINELLNDKEKRNK